MIFILANTGYWYVFTTYTVPKPLAAALLLGTFILLVLNPLVNNKKANIFDIIFASILAALACLAHPNILFMFFPLVIALLMPKAFPGIKYSVIGLLVFALILLPYVIKKASEPSFSRLVRYTLSSTNNMRDDNLDVLESAVNSYQSKASNTYISDRFKIIWKLFTPQGKTKSGYIEGRWSSKHNYLSGVIRLKKNYEYRKDINSLLDKLNYLLWFIASRKQIFVYCFFPSLMFISFGFFGFIFPKYIKRKETEDTKLLYGSKLMLIMGLGTLISYVLLQFSPDRQISNFVITNAASWLVMAACTIRIIYFPRNIAKSLVSLSATAFLLIWVRPLGVQFDKFSIYWPAVFIFGAIYLLQLAFVYRLWKTGGSMRAAHDN